MKLASFDIFDTTLIRKCGKPENIFFLLAQRLYPNDEAKRNDFVTWRKRAPHNIIKKVNKIELTLSDIYNDDDVTSYSEYSPKELAEYEIIIEKENLIANPYVFDLINEKRRQGYDIAFISDMYINKSILLEILIENGCAKTNDKIFVSCDVQKRKDSGDLYDYVRKELSPKKWEHYGDNRFSDIRMAKRNGIKVHFIDTGYNLLEKHLEELSLSIPQQKDLSLFAGLSRCARLMHKNDPYAIIAANYVAAAYIPFVINTIEYAQRSNIDILHFLSRDSYILQKIAESLPKNNITYNYLYISRRSLMRPYLSNSNETDYFKVVDRHTLIGRDVDHMLWQLLLNRKELSDKYHIEFPYKRIHNKTEEKDFINKIFHSCFTNEFQNNAKEEKNILLEYLKQEEVISNKKCALVDVGWLGTSRLMINRILEKEGFASTSFIYFGARNDIYGYKYGDYSTYFDAGTLNTNMTSLIENYYSASPYPTTIGYKKEGKEIKPVFPENATPVFNKIVNTNVTISKWIAKELHRMGIKNGPSLTLWAKTSLEHLSELKENIDLLPFIDSQDFDNDIFAKKLSISELLKFTLMGKRITHYDQASLYYTCGYRLAPFFMKLHKLSEKIRGYLYKRFVIR